MTHLLAVLLLGAVCALLYRLDRGADSRDDSGCPDAGDACGGCALGDAASIRASERKAE